MKILFCQIILFTMFFSSCKSQDKQLECFNKSLQNEELKSLTLQLKNGLNDTLQDWIYNKKYKNIQGLNGKIWKIDGAIFTNTKRDKAILLILAQDTAKYTTVPSDIPYAPEIIKPTSFDLIKLVYANKEKDSWHYYYQSMELLVIPRKEKVNGIPVPLTFEELSLTGTRNILLGYYKKGTCKYNNKFFDRWDIVNLKEQHKYINGYY